MVEGKLSGFMHFVKAFHWSLAGLKAAWMHEAAFRQETIISIVLIPLSFHVGEGALERGMLIASLFVVLIVELINSSIEAVVDRVGLEKNELSGRAKDLGSAAVFVSLISAILIWGLFLYEKYGHLLHEIVK